MVEIATSVLSVKPEKAIQTFYNLEVAGTDYFHMDVMDGKFVEKDTVQDMRQYTEYLKQISNLPIDVHFMVEDVSAFIQSYAALEPNRMTFHLEAGKKDEEIKEWIEQIKQSYAKVGIAIKPNTKIEEVYKWLPYIHMVLIMTVEPGKGGQDFLPEMVQKVEQLQAYVTKNSYEVDIQVDGGINSKTANLVKKAGANILVSGTHILKANSYAEKIQELKK